MENWDWRRRLELLSEIESMVEEMNTTVDAIIVEGEHDREALRSMGFRNPILLCSQTKLSHTELSEYVAERFGNTVILTDFDAEGVNLNKELRRRLELAGVKVENTYREKLGSFMKKLRVQTLEGLMRVKTKTP